MMFATCALTRTPIRTTDPAKIILLARTPAPYDFNFTVTDQFWSPVSLPITAVYDDFGRFRVLPHHKDAAIISFLTFHIGLDADGDLQLGPSYEQFSQVMDDIQDGLPVVPLLSSAYEADGLLGYSQLNLIAFHEAAYMAASEALVCDFGRIPIASVMERVQYDFMKLRATEKSTLYDRWIQAFTFAPLKSWAIHGSGPDSFLSGNARPTDAIMFLRSLLMDGASIDGPQSQALIEMISRAIALSSNLRALNIPYGPSIAARIPYKPDLPMLDALHRIAKAQVARTDHET